MNARKLSTLAMACFLALGLTAEASLLKAYVERPDDSYAYEIAATEEREGLKIHMVRLTSQTWQDIEWKHWLVVLEPDEIEHTDSSLLFITGGNNNMQRPSLNSGEIQIMSQVARNTKSVVAFLHQVPNQPLFDGLYEDDIIALTYERFLDGEGDDWPLLFPMVKSAVRAMDTVNNVMAERREIAIENFFLTGGSKRGWTAYLAAVADDRIKRIAPMIIDMLNIEPQMEHQLATYGGYSESISEYTERGLQGRMDTEAGQQLNAMVDPYSYRAELTLPKLVILGANDPYWTVDAANFYYYDLEGDKRLYYQANTRHDVSIGGIATTTKFYYAMLTGQDFPDIAWERNEDGALIVRWEKDGGSATLWQATSPNRDFRQSVWRSTKLEGAGEAAVTVEAPEEGWLAYYVEVNWPSPFGLPYGLTTTMTVIPETFPEPGTRAYDRPGAQAKRD